METTTLSFQNMHRHGELLVNLLKARKNAFIDKNSWALPQAEGMEYDQYDNPASRWVAVHEGETVLAGIRLTPTIAKCGMYSYMIRDAQKGMIDTIPRNLLNFEAPVDPDIWESSRVFVVNSVPARLRTRVQAAMMHGMIEAARELGARTVLGLVPAVWSRWIGRLGLEAEPAGPVMDIEGWKTQVALMHLKPAGDRRGEAKGEAPARNARSDLSDYGRRSSTQSPQCAPAHHKV
ncbi:N-acyl-L-homoserine lactone synthetase [Maritimibacter sp. 55A14]|uniref:acyl-homoserine-lactone synthase n=1 Tax=Maritimibacter sp. 55A14 TaxID=2174844 RepID=UPI000D606281|nr:acyl-homoserine-lactone synthase [Maritimibacter sp. 55A14]PWE31422.1 N-acyl-L-homoserine lactone synthetase [Maritimibacter sp. 55A14]